MPVARACSASVEPIPQANAPTAPWVPEFRRDDVHDTLVAIADVEQADAGRLGRSARARDEFPAPRHHGLVRSSRPGIDDVIDGAEDTRRVPYRAAALVQAFERDRARALVQEDSVNRNPGRTAAGSDNVCLPYFLEQGTCARDRLATS